MTVRRSSPKAASARTRASRKKAAPIPTHLKALGVYGFETQELAVLAALVTCDPLLLIGRSGTGKTYLLNSLSEALHLEHRHYNASLISFDDLVGFPYPDEEKSSIRFLETPATIWGAESVLVDEISRCKPEHQNRLFSLVHERKLQGLPLEPHDESGNVFLPVAPSSEDRRASVNWPCSSMLLSTTSRRASSSLR